MTAVVSPVSNTPNPYPNVASLGNHLSSSKLLACDLERTEIYLENLERKTDAELDRLNPLIEQAKKELQRPSLIRLKIEAITLIAIKAFCMVCSWISAQNAFSASSQYFSKGGKTSWSTLGIALVACLVTNLFIEYLSRLLLARIQSLTYVSHLVSWVEEEKKVEVKLFQLQELHSSLENMIFDFEEPAASNQEGLNAGNSPAIAYSNGQKLENARKCLSTLERTIQKIENFLEKTEPTKEEFGLALTISLGLCFDVQIYQNKLYLSSSRGELGIPPALFLS